MQAESLFSGKLNLYQIEDEWVSWNATNSEVASHSGLEAWMLFALDKSIPANAIIEDLVTEGHDKSTVSTQLEQLQKALELPDSQDGYAQEFAHIQPSPTVKTSISNDDIHFLLLNKNIVIHCEDEALHELISALFTRHPINTNNDTFAFSIVRYASEYQIYCNHHLLTSTENLKEVMPLLMDHIQIISYQHSDYLLAIHAAMLNRGDSGIILAGASGSGKSTLCAALSQQSFIPYSDEIALIDGGTLTLSPMVLPMAIKTGSWNALQETYPKLVNYPEWQREDGRILKYLPLDFNNHELPTCKVQALVFPKFNAETSTPSMEKLSVVSALQEISVAGYQIKDHLDQTKFETLLGWLKEVPAYRIEYADSQAGVKLVEDILHA